MPLPKGKSTNVLAAYGKQMSEWNCFSWSITKNHVNSDQNVNTKKYQIVLVEFILLSLKHLKFKKEKKKTKKTSRVKNLFGFQCWRFQEELDRVAHLTADMKQSDKVIGWSQGKMSSLRKHPSDILLNSVLPSTIPPPKLLLKSWIHQWINLSIRSQGENVCSLSLGFLTL